jgi:hypothetical protein
VPACCRAPQWVGVAPIPRLELPPLFPKEFECFWRPVRIFVPTEFDRAMNLPASAVVTAFVAPDGESSARAKASGPGKAPPSRTSAAAFCPVRQATKLAVAVLLGLLLVAAQSYLLHAQAVPQAVRVCQCDCCDPAECCMESSGRAPSSAPTLPTPNLGREQSVFLPAVAALPLSWPALGGSELTPPALAHPAAFAVPLYQRDCRYRI